MSEIIANFHFIRPIALLLLPMAAGLWWIASRNADPLRGWRTQIEPDLLAALKTSSDSQGVDRITWAAIAWIVATISIAGPTWRIEPSPFADEATPLMIVLKADLSMETTDVAPTRLERAKLKIADLAEARKGQPLGLIAYAGSAHLVLPPTRDTAVVSQMANEISPDIMPKLGDQLDLALIEATRVLTENGIGGSVLVIADTIDTEVDLIRKALEEHPISIQFLNVISTESANAEGSIEAVTQQIHAKTTSLSIDDSDITNIISIAARSPMSASGVDGERWQEYGYWLVPIVALLLLMSFRRETGAGESEVM